MVKISDTSVQNEKLQYHNAVNSFQDSGKSDNIGEYLANNTTPSPKENSATSCGYTKTSNTNVYCKDNVYYFWDETKQKFSTNLKIVKVYDSGYLETKNGGFLTPEGKPYIKVKGGDYRSVNEGDYFKLRFMLAKVYGYETVENFKSVQNAGNYGEWTYFYDKKNNEYLRYDKDSQTFMKTNISEVIPYKPTAERASYYKTKDGKFYKEDYYYHKNNHKEISEEEYLARKNDLSGTNKKHVYVKASDTTFLNRYFGYDPVKKTFFEFGDYIDKEKMLQGKADGKIDSFRQGNNGDCWMLCFINTTQSDNLPEDVKKRLQKAFSECCKVDKETGDVTVTLKGPGKQYLITNEEMNKILKEYNYLYSYGDKDVLAMELAMEKYKTEIKENKNIPNRVKVKNIYNYNYRPNNNTQSAIHGGQPFDAIHLFTGMESHYIYNNMGKESCWYIDNNTTPVKSGPDDTKLKNLLKQNIVIASLKVQDDDRDSYHGVLITAVEGDEILYIDSNKEMDQTDTRIVSRMSKDEFFRNLIAITYTDLKTPISEKKSKPFGI